MAEGASNGEALKPSIKEVNPLSPVDSKKSAEKLPNEPLAKETNSRRRRLLKGLAAAAALTGIALWGSKEVKVQKEGIETQNATFIPLYERHDVGFDAKDIPSDLDVLFREGIPHGYDIDSPPYGYIRTKSSIPGVMGKEATPMKKFQDGVLEKLAHNEIGIANADINPGVTIDETRRLVGARSAIELVAAVVPWT